jgi:2,4-dienoyl-CoA reductase-like NADH-dependent reductase (Old Yellow Enzyme family)
MKPNKFNYETIEDIKKDLDQLGINLPTSKNTDLLKKSIVVEGRTLPNSMAVHPMEGCDGNTDGTPGELTIRRYERFAAGGAGLLWFEAVAVVPEGRANPRQLYICKDNLQAYKDIYKTIIDTAHKANGDAHTPLCVMQLTHSGRFSVPEGKPAPVISYHNPYLNQRMNLDEDYPVITDEELEALEDKYVEAARLAKIAGFDGVDVKGCHRYLASELLSAYNRDGKYGGDFEGRTRFILNIVDKIKKELGDDFIIATRLNIYDGIPYP